LTPKKANSWFWQPLRGTPWCLNSRKNLFKVGYHTYRHSFASNLAARGVDQRIIDEWLGHMTAGMRRRYRHLFPTDRRSAIECFSLAVNGPATAPNAMLNGDNAVTQGQPGSLNLLWNLSREARMLDVM